MGKWVILIGGAKFGPEKIKSMSFEEKIGVRDYGEKQFDVLFRESYISFQFDFDGAIAQDYSPEEYKNLPFTAPKFVIMKYSDQRRLERILASSDFPSDVFIDCDGVDLGLERFVDQARLLNCKE